MFGAHLHEARAAMAALAMSIPVSEINQRAFALYTGFRPEIPEGAEGWGASEALSLLAIRHVVDQKRSYSSQQLISSNLRIFAPVRHADLHLDCKITIPTCG